MTTTKTESGVPPSLPRGASSSWLLWTRVALGGLAAAIALPPAILILAIGHALAHVPTVSAASLASAAALQAVAQGGNAPPPASQVSMTVVSCVAVATLALLSRASRVSLDGVEREPLSLATAAAVAAPAVVLACALSGSSTWAGDGSVARGLIAVCIAGPLLTAAAVARIWRGRPSLEAAVALEAAILRAALAGSGVTLTQSTVAGMHTVALTHPARAATAAALPPLVLLHGYGSGSALWLFNAAALARGYEGDVYLCDWRGCACSPRVTWPAGASPPVAEAFFLDALDAWRVAGGFEQLAIVGHSLGGFLAAAYWLRDPARVAGLFLVSPVGLPVAPPPPPPGLGPEFTGGMVRNSGLGGTPQPRRIPRWAWRISSFLWDSGVTPSAGMRALGPLGPWCARGGVRGRASRWTLTQPFPEGTLEQMGDYLFHTHASSPSGERALSAILQPGAYARDALIPRFRAALAAAPPAGAGTTMPVALFYGKTHDWMDSKAGEEAAKLFVAAGYTTTKVVLVPDSGHHLYLENVEAFNKSLLSECAALCGGPAGGVAKMG